MSGICQHGRTKEQGCITCMEIAVSQAGSSFAAPTLLGRYYVHLREMTWPLVTQEVRELEWKLRYAQKSLTETECFVIAGIVAAYVQMVGDTQEKRNMVCREIREASQRPDREVSEGGTRDSQIETAAQSCSTLH